MPQAMYSTYSRYALKHTVPPDVIFSRITKLMIQADGRDELSKEVYRNFQVECARKTFLCIVK